MRPKPDHQLRDYITDADAALESLDPAFSPEDTSIFIEHKPLEIDPVQKQLALVDAQVSVLTKESRQAQWDADKLALARDLAQIGSLYKQHEKNEKGKRLERIGHIRSQNTIGAAIISEYMDNNMAVHCGIVKDQTNVANRVWCLDKNLNTNSMPNLESWWMFAIFMMYLVVFSQPAIMFDAVWLPVTLKLINLHICSESCLSLAPPLAVSPAVPRHASGGLVWSDEVWKNGKLWNWWFQWHHQQHPPLPLQGLYCNGDCAIPGVGKAAGLPWAAQDWWAWVQRPSLLMLMLNWTFKSHISLIHLFLSNSYHPSFLSLGFASIHDKSPAGLGKQSLMPRTSTASI